MLASSRITRITFCFTAKTKTADAPTSSGTSAVFFMTKQRQHRTIPALRLKHRSGSCGTASALPIGSLFPPLAALTFAASSIICAFGLASAAPRSPYRHLELCGIALKQKQRPLIQQALFCCNSFGWGWDAFVQEANTGKGLKVQPWMKPIFRFVVPAAIAFIYIYGMATFTWN